MSDWQEENAQPLPCPACGSPIFTRANGTIVPHWSGKDDNKYAANNRLLSDVAKCDCWRHENQVCDACQGLSTPPAEADETIHVPPGGLPSPVKQTMPEQMTEAIQHGDVAGRLKADEAELAALKAGIAGQELPPLDVTDEDRSDARTAVVELFGPEWGDIKKELTNAEAECIALKRNREHLIETIQAERTLREQTEAKVASQAEEMAGLREKLEVANVAFTKACWDSSVERQTAEADNKRLREALTIEQRAIELGCHHGEIEPWQARESAAEQIAALKPVDGQRLEE